MNENTIRNLIDALGKAIDARAANQALDIPALRLALTNAVQEALATLQPDPRVSREEQKKAVLDAIKSELPRGSY